MLLGSMATELKQDPKYIVLGAHKIDRAADKQAIFDLDNKCESTHDCNELQIKRS